MSVEFNFKIPAETEVIFDEEALKFLENLHNKFDGKIKEVLDQRIHRQKKFNDGEFPKFLSETKEVRESDWKVRDIPEDILDRRVEITGPVDRKMIINALNSDVKVFMADFEDSLSPTWENVARGQLNLYDAVRKTITFENPDNGKKYKLNDDTAVLMCRVRGLHLIEKGLKVNEQNPYGCLCDFGFYLFHNAKELINNGTGPYFYIPKLQSHYEARLWNEIINYSEDYLNLPRGTVRVTCLIETLPAVFEMDEILFELKDHIVGLNCGRWDYIFSYIKTFQNFPDKLLPDRYQVGMSQPFLNATLRLLIKTCHARSLAKVWLLLFPQKILRRIKLYQRKLWQTNCLKQIMGMMEHGLLTQDYLTLLIMYFPTPLKQEILINYMFYVKMTKLQKRI